LFQETLDQCSSLADSALKFPKNVIRPRKPTRSIDFPHTFSCQTHSSKSDACVASAPVIVPLSTSAHLIAPTDTACFFVDPNSMPFNGLARPTLAHHMLSYFTNRR
jgi:hypothetical protein